LFIHETMIDARVKVHGMPPSDFDLQREWYREALRDSLRVAAETKKVSHIKEKAPLRQNNTLAPLPGPGPGPSTVDAMGYDVSMAATNQMPHTPIMNNNIPGMSVLPSTYHSATPQHTLPHQWEMATNVPDPMTLNPAMNYQFFESPGAMTDNNRQPFPPAFNFIDQSNQNDFDFPDWQGQQGGQ
jgi:hypothetical protein